MSNLVNKLTTFLGVSGEEDKDKVSDPAANDNEQVERLSAQVEQTNLDVAKKSANCALEEIMEGWKIKGSA